MNKKEFLKYAVAFCYGDGGVYMHGNNARFEANVTEDHKDYVDWRVGILETLTAVNTYTIYRKNPNHKNLTKTYTRTHPTYTKIRHRLYNANHKVLDPHYLKLMDWETLAIWYMDDGCLGKVHYNSRKNGDYLGFTPRVTLATHCFSYAENIFLKELFKKTFNLEFNVIKATGRQTQYWQLALRSKDYKAFESGVCQFILPSFGYKLVQYERPQRELGDEKVRTIE